MRRLDVKTKVEVGKNIIINDKFENQPLSEMEKFIIVCLKRRVTQN